MIPVFITCATSPYYLKWISTNLSWLFHFISINQNSSHTNQNSYNTKKTSYSHFGRDRQLHLGSSVENGLRLFVTLDWEKDWGNLAIISYISERFYFTVTHCVTGCPTFQGFLFHMPLLIDFKPNKSAKIWITLVFLLPCKYTI